MRCKDWKHNAVLFFCAALLCLGLSGCGENDKHSIRFFSMDTLMQITAYGDAETSLIKARETIERLDKKLDATEETSLVSALKDSTVLDADGFALLQTAKMISDCTDGALDVTLYPLSDAWGFYSKEYRVPSAEEITFLLHSRGTWSLTDRTLHCSVGTKFDLGSVAKGYAAQCAADTLR